MKTEILKFGSLENEFSAFMKSIAFVCSELRLKQIESKKSLLYDMETGTFTLESDTQNAIFKEHCLVSGSRDNWIEVKGEDTFLVKIVPVEIGKEQLVLEMKIMLNREILQNALANLNIGETLKYLTDKVYHDPLTGAYNRNYLNEQGKHLEIAALAVIDMDNFKAINDTYGHLAGDIALKTVYDTIQASVRKKDILIRYGGDEFILLMKDICRESFKTRMEDVCIRLQKATLDGYPLAKLSCSIGGVMSTRCNDDAIKAADENMYVAKKQRNAVYIS